MIKTKHGNDQKSYEEFKDELKKFSKNIDEDDCRKTYEELTYYLIREIEEMTPGHYDWAYETAIKYIKKEFRHKFKVLYVSLSYDAPPYCLVPQDMPYRLVLIDTEKGGVITVESLYKIIKEKRDENQIDKRN